MTAKGIRVKRSAGQQVEKWRKAKTRGNKEAPVCVCVLVHGTCWAVLLSNMKTEVSGSRKNDST